MQFLVLTLDCLIPTLYKISDPNCCSCNSELSAVLTSIDSSAIASNIQHHADFTPLFSPEHSSPLKAYHATAKSVFDSLIMNWNATYDYYNKVNAKQAYYLSMEFLQVSQYTSFRLISYFWATAL